MADFDQIPSNISIGAMQSVRRNAADTAFEAFTIGMLASLSSINNSNWSGTALAISNGGTGQTSASAAFNALAPSQTSNANKFLKSDGTNTSWDYPMKIGDLVSDSTAKGVLYAGALGVLAQDNANFVYDYSNVWLGLGTNAPTERLTVNKSGIAATVTNAVGIRNTTAASGGVGNQYSPAIEFEAHTFVQSITTDKTALSRNYLYAPYVPTGVIVQAKHIFEINRDGSGWESMFELVNRATQSPTDSNCFRFYSPNSNVALDMSVDTSGNIAMFAKDTTTLKNFIAAGIGGHGSYQAFDCSTYYAPEIRANFNGAITLKAGAGASGSEKVSCLLPLEIAGNLQVYKTTQQLEMGYSSSQKWTATTDSAGITTFSGIGTAPKFVFAKPVTARITPRVRTQTDVATLTPNIDSYDAEVLTAQNQTLTIANPTGTPTDGQILWIRILDVPGIGDSVSYGSKYRAGSIALPAGLSGGGTTTYLEFIYNNADDTYDLIRLIDSII